MSLIQSSVTFAMMLNAPLENVRSAVQDPAWSKWIPFLKSDQCSGTTAGSARVCVMAHPDPQFDGYELQEKIVENNPEQGRFSYSISNPPMPVQNLAGTIETQPTETGQVLATWTTTFEATPENLAAAKPMMLQSYQAAFMGLDSYAQRQAT